VLLDHLDARQSWFDRIEQLRRQLLDLKDLQQQQSHFSYSLEFIHEKETYLERDVQASSSNVLALLDQLFLAAPS